MGYVKWSYDTLNTFCHDVFRKFGFNEEETNIIKDVLLTADLYGIESHGMQRMVRYDKGIEKGTIHPDAKPEVVFETPVSAVIDGHDGARFSAPSFPWVLLLINVVHLKTRQVSVMDLLPLILQSSEMQMISGHISQSIWKLFVRVQRQKAQSRFILMVRRKYLQKKSAERMAFL